MKPRLDHAAVELERGRWYVRHRPSTRVVAGPFDTPEDAQRNAAKRDRIALRKRSDRAKRSRTDGR